MAGSKDFDHKSALEAEIAETETSSEFENLMKVADEDAVAKDLETKQEIESVGFMVDDQNELVDLDALFDALNVAAKDGVDAMSYIEDSDSGSVLVVTNEALAKAGIAASVEDLGHTSDDIMKDQIISDES